MKTSSSRRPTSCFNSRTREGCDFPAARPQQASVFQFTHPRGVRYIHKEILMATDVSIHAPARGAITTVMEIARKAGFNSRTREGCDEF